MGKYTDLGNSVECDGSRICVRWITNNPSLVKQGPMRLFKYKSKTRSIVIITKELAPKEHRISSHSKLDLNDELEADTMEIYLEKRVSFDLASNFSHVHGIQQSDVSAFTYAKIIIPWRHMLQKALVGPSST